VHTAQGEPMYFECKDDFVDLRERLWGLIERLRNVLGWQKEKVLTLILDRSLFGRSAGIWANICPELSMLPFCLQSNLRVDRAGLSKNTLKCPCKN
jgi:hypothetical protein